MKIKYNIIINKVSENKTINGLEISVRKDMLFPNLIRKILKENNIKSEFVHVDNLMTNTWKKIFSPNLASYMSGRDYYYEWLNYRIDNIQETFKLFDQELNIVCDNGGYGGYIGGIDGIKFYIHSNEKDRHANEPHIHCKYSDEEMRIRIDTLNIMKKDKPFKNRKKLKKAILWIQNNQAELLKYYQEFAIKGNAVEAKFG